MASRMGDTLLEKAIEVKGIKVLAARMDGADEWSEDVWAEASLPYVAVAYKSATGVGTIQLGHAGQMAVA